MKRISSYPCAFLFFCTIFFIASATAEQYGYDDSCCYCHNSCLGTFSFGGDWLHWKTQESRLDYAAHVTFTGEDSNVEIDARVLRPHFKYDNGYRVFADYTTCDQLWRLSATFSHIPSHARNHFTGSMGMMTVTFASLFPANFPILNVISDTQFNTVNSKWDSSISYFDFDLSRNFSVCDCLDLVPHLGFRGLWMHQKLGLEGMADTLFFSTTLKGKFSSYGLEGGVTGIWRIYNGLSLIGNLGGSLLYAIPHKRGNLIANVDGASPQTIAIHLRDREQRGFPTFDAFLGLKYIGCFSCFRFDVHVGWEEHVIFNTNDFSISGSDNTTLQGLTLGGSISF